MLALRRNAGRVLEPAAGKGAFLSCLDHNAVGIELDCSLAATARSAGRAAAPNGIISRAPQLLHMDFFAYPTSEQFDTIIGNPPYVRFRDISPATKHLLPTDLFDQRSNLYLFFIAKCMQHLTTGGELIFITPRDFIKATSARKLNAALYDQGSITHYLELGDAAIFANATPNCAIWRWEKGRTDRRMQTGGHFNCRDGQIWFGQASSRDGHSTSVVQLSDFMDLKVGAVSGADEVFITNRKRTGTMGTAMVCSRTASTGETRQMLYNRYHQCLDPHKPRLLRRKIRTFTEDNWWQWGRNYCARPGRRVYVNCKTRHPKPFFASDHEAYDGSVIALFPKPGINPDRAASQLNRVDWHRLGFVCAGRLLFTQRSLATAPVGL